MIICLVLMGLSEILAQIGNIMIVTLKGFFVLDGMVVVSNLIISMGLGSLISDPISLIMTITPISVTIIILFCSFLQVPSCCILLFLKAGDLSALFLYECKGRDMINIFYHNHTRSLCLMYLYVIDDSLGLLINLKLRFCHQFFSLTIAFQFLVKILESPLLK